MSCHLCSMESYIVDFRMRIELNGRTQTPKTIKIFRIIESLLTKMVPLC